MYILRKIIAIVDVLNKDVPTLSIHPCLSVFCGILPILLRLSRTLRFAFLFLLYAGLHPLLQFLHGEAIVHNKSFEILYKIEIVTDMYLNGKIYGSVQSLFTR